MDQEFKPGQIVPESGIYRITHDPQHADMPHEVTVIKGRHFPTCRHCKGIAVIGGALGTATGAVGGAANMLAPPAPAGCPYGYAFYNGACYPAR